MTRSCDIFALHALCHSWCTRLGRLGVAVCIKPILMRYCRLPYNIMNPLDSYVWMKFWVPYIVPGTDNSTGIWNLQVAFLNEYSLSASADRSARWSWKLFVKMSLIRWFSVFLILLKMVLSPEYRVWCQTGLLFYVPWLICEF